MHEIDKITATLCFPITADRVLLGKKRRRLGAGWWNGFGGRVKRGEAIFETAVRELEEECGLRSKAEDLAQKADITFHYQGASWRVHVFFVRAWEGEPAESDEMGELTWFLHREIPFEEMWPSDRAWVPRVLRGENLKGEIHFNKDDRTVFRIALERVLSF